jgi:ABC-type sugar transport system permease subunit
MGGAYRIDREAKRAYWIMVSPAFLLFLLVMAFPILLSLVLSVSNYSGGKMFGGEPWGFAGFSQYLRAFEDPWFWNALKNNLYIVGISVFGQLPLGFVFAYIIYRKLVRAPGFWQGILYVPNIISIIVVGLLWQSIFSPNGPIADVMNKILRKDFQGQLALVVGNVSHLNWSDATLARIIELGGKSASSMFTEPVRELRALLATYPADQAAQVVNDLTNLFVTKWSPTFLNVKDVAMLPVLFVILWMYTGMYLILFLANMQKIDTQIIESARIDGANEMQVMRHIILPALSGTIVNSAILAISGSLSCFALVLALTGGGPSRITEILSIYMYNNAFLGRPNFPLANAIAFITVGISMILIFITKLVERRYGGKEE